MCTYLPDEADSSRGSQTDENPPPVKRSKLFANCACTQVGVTSNVWQHSAADSEIFGHGRYRDRLLGILAQESNITRQTLSAGDESLERSGFQRSGRKSFQSGWAEPAAKIGHD